MSKSHPRARVRAALTGQNYQHALQSIHRDGLGRRPISYAEPGQAQIETLVLERIGDWAPTVCIRQPRASESCGSTLPPPGSPSLSRRRTCRT